MTSLFKKGNTVKWEGTEGEKAGRLIKGLVKTNEKLGNNKIEIEQYNTNNRGAHFTENYKKTRPVLSVSKNKLRKINGSSVLFKKGNTIRWEGTEEGRAGRMIKGLVKTNEKAGNNKIEIEQYNTNNKGNHFTENYKKTHPVLSISKNKLRKINGNVQKSNTSSVTVAPGKMNNSMPNFKKFNVGSDVIYTTKAGNNKIYVVQPTNEENQIVIRPIEVRHNNFDKIIKTKNQFARLRKRPMPGNADWRNEVLNKCPIGTKVTYRSKDNKPNRVGIISAKLYLSDGKESIRINPNNEFPNASQITSLAWVNERKLTKI